jgi:chemotaxis protein MotA
MFAIIGIVVVFGAVLGGYLMEKGHILVLLQPAELVIIAGAAVGTVLVANPTHTLKQIAGGLAGVFGASKYGKARYAELLQMMFQVFNSARRGGWAAVEGDIEDPAKSKIFSAYPAMLADHHMLAFVCDSLRTAAIGAVEPFDLDQMMEVDMDAHHHEAAEPVAALSTMADSLPGLGIVAAVLGVVITMGALGGPPEEIGHKVAAALVGTFLGILLCYGLVGPLATRMGKSAEEERACHHVLRVAIISFVKGTPPIVAVEMARRAIPPHVRPGFKETENACRSKRAEAAPAPAA